MLRLALLAAFVLQATSLATGQARTDTLRLDTAAAIQLALADSPEVAIEEAGVAFAEARAAQARAARYLTTFEVTTGHALAPTLDVPDDTPFPRDALYLDHRVRDHWRTPRPYNQIEVDLLQPIFTWGEITGRIDAARAAIDVERAQVDARVTEVALRTGELAEGLAAAQELTRLAAEAEDVLARARAELVRLLDEGDPGVTDADMFQLRLFEQELRAQRVEVAERRQLAASALARQLRQPGRPVAAAALAPLRFDPPDLEQLQAAAVLSRPELRQTAAGVQARQALVQVVRSDLYPKLFAGASASRRYAPGRERQRNPFIVDPYIGGGLRAGLGLRQNLTFDQTRARVQQAEAELDEVRHQQVAAEQLVLFEVEEAHRNLTIAAARLAATGESAAIAAEWLRLEQINFDLELGEIRDLIGAARADLQARLARIEAVRAFNVSILRLFAAAGTLPREARHGALFD